MSYIKSLVCAPLALLTACAATPPAETVSPSGMRMTRMPHGRINPATPVKGESTPGINALFEEFSKCREDIFDHVARRRTDYEMLGQLAPLGANGMWFAVKPLDSDSKEYIYRFEKPLKIHGLTAVAAAYALYEGDAKSYSGGGSTFWGFYFAENADTVQATLRSKVPTVSSMRYFHEAYDTMRISDRGGKRTEQGGILSDDTSKPYAKSYFSCTIQIKLLDKK